MCSNCLHPFSIMVSRGVSLRREERRKESRLGKKQENLWRTLIGGKGLEIFLPIFTFFNVREFYVEFGNAKFSFCFFICGKEGLLFFSYSYFAVFKMSLFICLLTCLFNVYLSSYLPFHARFIYLVICLSICLHLFLSTSFTHTNTH